jgi:hypothetical protein
MAKTNAPMPDKPLKLKRRWFQFSLATFETSMSILGFT